MKELSHKGGCCDHHTLIVIASPAGRCRLDILLGSARGVTRAILRDRRAASSPEIVLKRQNRGTYLCILYFLLYMYWFRSL